MTIVIGLKATYNGERCVYIGADSQGTTHTPTGTVIYDRRDPKLFRNGAFVIAIRGWFRIGQLLRFADLPEPPVGMMSVAADQWMVKHLIPAVQQEILDKGRFTPAPDTREYFMIAWDDRLYVVWLGDWQFRQVRTRYDIIGSTEDAARTGMDVTEGSDTGIEQRLLGVMMSCARNSGRVGGHFKVLRTRPGWRPTKAA